MNTAKKIPLDELFHQPVRLEIMAELSSSANGKTFIELREGNDLTDGNLSRHLQALVQAGAVKLKKTFVNARPLTTVYVTAKGRESFLNYLQVLEEVLSNAVERAKSGSKRIDVTEYKSAKLVSNRR